MEYKVWKLIINSVKICDSKLKMWNIGSAQQYIIQEVERISYKIKTKNLISNFNNNAKQIQMLMLLFSQTNSKIWFHKEVSADPKNHIFWIYFDSIFNWLHFSL